MKLMLLVTIKNFRKVFIRIGEPIESWHMVINFSSTHHSIAVCFKMLWYRIEPRKDFMPASAIVVDTGYSWAKAG